MFNDHFGIGCELEVIEMEGWNRNMWFEETGLHFVLPSPNIPTVDTCVVFPATVHLEGTELSEGRGTTKPFELNGAPFIDPREWVAALDAYEFPGIAFREAYFRPTFCEFAGETCGGLQMHIFNRDIFRPVMVGVAMVKTVYDMYPEQFQWRQNAYEYVFDQNPMDVVCGTDKIRKAIETGVSLKEIEDSWEPGLKDFAKAREPYILY
jgi:uncharacterized protein YbbC (DUF1343 family)